MATEPRKQLRKVCNNPMIIISYDSGSASSDSESSSFLLSLDVRYKIIYFSVQIQKI